MKTLNRTLIALSLSMFVAVPAFAAHGYDRPLKRDNVFERLERQHHRIDQGVRHRQLTRKEAKILRRQQRDIRNLARLFYRDGHFSKKERRLLNRQLSESNQRIKRLKHNDLERYVDLHQRYGYRDHARRL